MVEGLAGTVRVTAGDEHACAVLRSGDVSCWGRNDVGQLGVTDPTSSPRAVTVPGLHGVADLSAARDFTCALLRSGGVSCWGDAGLGGLGGGLGGGSVLPVSVRGLGDAVQVSAGPFHTCAVRRTGRVACWGWNGEGALGDGTTETRATPVEVAGIDDAVRVAAGRLYTCATRATGEVRCWGRGAEGQLGRAPIPVRDTPLRVEGLDGPGAATAAAPVREEVFEAPARAPAADGPCIDDLESYCGDEPCPTRSLRLAAFTRAERRIGQRVCGDHRVLAWSTPFEGATEYYDAEGRLVGAEGWVDYARPCLTGGGTGRRVFGRVPACL